MDNTIRKKVYRFKFSNNMMNLLKDFSFNNKDKTKKEFDISWKEWLDNNSNEIDNEINNMDKNGFYGDIYKKMYVSCRYYYTKKCNSSNTSSNNSNNSSNNSNTSSNNSNNSSNNSKSNLKEDDVEIISKENNRVRKIYVKLPKDILIDIDNDIKSNIMNDNYKPSTQYKLYFETNYYKYQELYDKISDKFEDYNEFEKKIKKTYKNRHYIISKSIMN
jgi:cobalamin biosynthesis protein CobT